MQEQNRNQKNSIFILGYHIENWWSPLTSRNEIKRSVQLILIKNVCCQSVMRKTIYWRTKWKNKIQPPPVYEAIFGSCRTEALKPVLAAGEFVKSIGSQLSSTTKFLGGEVGEFVKDLGSVSKNIGKGLKDGVTKALDTIGSGFESLEINFQIWAKAWRLVHLIL
ncbi:unnamed protein product [Mytilus coruscus]|uniref:Uncharacterized protein n=1 Tax=Mytilus coruscus TaxID=42192 RepID=A0A6J8DA11_MYTCO|nr:unnamed protein product [Mytilus coruscus]